MKFWKVIEENLWNEGYDVLVENNSIEWQSEKGNHRIDYKNIAHEAHKLAWYQDEEYGRSWVKIKYLKGLTLSWKPFSSHPDWGFRWHYIKWFGDNLIIIYSEKHSDYIIKINQLNVETVFCGQISELHIHANLIFLRIDKKTVRVVDLSLEFRKEEEFSNQNFSLSFEHIGLKSFRGSFLLHLDEDYNKS